MHPDWPLHLAGFVLMAAGGFIIAYALIASTFERGLPNWLWLERARRKP